MRKILLRIFEGNMYLKIVSFIIYFENKNVFGISWEIIFFLKKKFEKKKIFLVKFF